MNEENIAKLKKKRSISRSAVTKILNKLESDINDGEIVNVNELEENLELLNVKADLLRSVDGELEAVLKTEEIESHLENVDEYQDKIILTKFRTNKRIREIRNQNLLIGSSSTAVHTVNDVSSEKVHNSSETVNVKLPKFTINRFFGDISQWLTFWHSYESAVHQNESLNKVDKFNYLRAHVGGAAMNTINGFSITPDNYDKAINLLTDRYGRKDVLINTHMSNLLNITPLRRSNDIKSFRMLLDNCQTQIRSLTSLGISSETYGNLLCPIILKCLPSDLVFEFNKDIENSEYKVDNLIAFLSKQLNAREKSGSVPDEFQRSASSESGYDSTKKYKRGLNRKEKIPTSADLLSADLSENKDNVCIFCNKRHPPESCDYARNISMDERKSILLKKGACFRCLKQNNHLARQCKVKVICVKCKGRHFDVMCFSGRNNCFDKTEIRNRNEVDEHTVLANSCTNEVYLQTLVVKMISDGKEYLTRAIIDSGSQKSYISKFVAEKVGLKLLGEETVIHGLFGGVEKREKHKKYLVNLCNVNDTYQIEFEAMDQKKICSDIPKVKDRACLKELERFDIFVSDIALNENSCLFERSPKEIHVLIGADLVGKLFTGEMRQLTKGLVAMNTHLGWTVVGKMGDGGSVDSSLLVLSLHVNNAQVSDLWNLDSLGITDPIEKKTKTELEELAFEYFKETVTRDNEGRYQVRIPWVEGHPPLLNNESLSRKRLSNTVRSLGSTSKLEDYQQVFMEWENENIIERVNSSSDVINGKGLCVHYLPHRAVIKENSTTKIRPVFDGSARTRDSASLNDCIEKGPNLIELIPSVLNRFRWGKIGAVADIRKAFLQISLHPDDRNFLRFLWWSNGDPASEICYRHCRVVFGISCSPFLLAAVLNHHLDQAPKNLGETVEKIKGSMYVDNCVTSVDSYEELELFRSRAQELMVSAKFDLRGWEYTRPFTPIDLRCGEETIPVLGLAWDPNDDTLSIDLKQFTDEETCPTTKRKILSSVHKIFDPIGFSCPFTLIPKLLLQECWKGNVSWDSELPPEIVEKYRKWRKQIPELKKFKIPRRLSALEIGLGDISLHVFCDACQSSYATCIFLRVCKGSEVTCQLLQARSKVAPLRKGTIPRLELLSCSIGARLANTVRKDLKIPSEKTFFWTDSMDALYWIKKKDNWGVFVANRVKEIRSLSSSEQWNFVPGIQNPADLPSRGASMKKLIKEKWWEGPSWLRCPEDEWPYFKLSPNEENVNAERKKIIVSVVNEEKTDFFYRISSYMKMIRITAWLYRFLRNAKRSDQRKEGPLTVEEIKNAEKVILKKVQEEFLLEENGKRLRNLSIKTDVQGLLRVKTKIFMRKDEENFRLPVVLPSEHQVVKNLIMWKHKELGHAGVQYLMAILREDYWILNSRKTIKKVINACTICKKYQAKPVEVTTGILPENRVRDALAFEVIGVDLCGPLYLRNGSKSWAVMFTCAVYRAVHVELVTSLSTESFILALRRFISRRGRPSVVYSDNGTNLAGTSNELESVDWSKLQDFSTSRKITWKFNPPSAPWWGGFWERLIGMLKAILRRVLGNARLDYEDLYTILCDAENVMNNRPLTYMSEDCNDLVPLTPMMFLQELKEVGVPDLDFIDSHKVNKRYAYRQRIREQIRKRFRIEYLGQLREYCKSAKNDNLSKGDVVLLGEDNKRRNHWCLARVINLYPGKDGIARVAEIKTKHGTYLRPVQKLYPLEIKDKNKLPTPDPCKQGIPSKDVSNDLVPEVPGVVTIRRSRYGRPLKSGKRMNL